MKSLLSLVQLPHDEQSARGLRFTPREIAQQPETWQRTLHLFEQHRDRVVSFLERARVRGTLEQRPVVVLIGAGTSDYIGHALALLLREQWGCDVVACASTDLLPNLSEFIVPGRRYLWISFSRSGDSPEGVALLEQAIQQHPLIAHLVITCNPQARMAEICQGNTNASVLVLDDAVNDRSLVMTSSFTNMLVLGHCLAHAWSLDSYKSILRSLRTAGDRLLIDGFAVAATLAEQKFSRVCFVGSGALAAVAKESALKVLEMSAGAVKTMAETTLGLRHGPMAALDMETLFVCFASGEARRQGYAVDLLREIGAKRITGARIAVGPASAGPTMEPLCDTYIPIAADVPDHYRAVLDVLFGQMLGLCISIEHGLHPDAPSPYGVISRVVQEFAIYR